MEMNFFNLNNQSCLINLHGRKIKFENQQLLNGFSLDIQENMTQIIRELYERNFNIPGYTVEFHFNVEKATYSIFSIENKEKDLLVFPDRVNLPKKEVCIYSDNSGSLDVYALNDWESDKHEFVNGIKFHRQMNKLSRLHLGYSLYGNKFTTNGGDFREYSPNDNEPKFYYLNDIELEVFNFLKGILKHIKSYPKQKIIKNLVCEPKNETLNTDFLGDNKIYAFKEIRSYDDNNSTEILPNRRLLSLGIKLPEHKHKDIMHEGFVYMDIGKNLTEPTNSSTLYNYSGMNPKKIYEVIPKNYNLFFVLDASIFQDLRNSWIKENPNCKFLTDKQVNEFRSKEAESLIPINEYKNNYKKPIIITPRILWEDELIEIQSNQKYE